jgi:hypothetical protein
MRHSFVLPVSLFRQQPKYTSGVNARQDSANPWINFPDRRKRSNPLLIVTRQAIPSLMARQIYSHVVSLLATSSPTHQSPVIFHALDSFGM